MNFTVANHNSLKITNGYIHYDDVEFKDIPEMVTAGFNYVACKLKNETRIDNNFDGFVDVLILDIDDGCTIEQAKSLFQKYEFYLITSKSHQKDKGGISCDRFRLFLHLENTVYIREQMEHLYNQVIQKYSFIDNKCKNVSRLYFASPLESLVIYNQGKRYPTSILFNSVTELGQKSTNDVWDIPQHTSNEIYRFNELLEVWITDGGQVLENEVKSNEENNIKGVLKFLDMEFYQGNKGHALFNASCIMRKDGFNDDFIIDFLMKEWEKRSCSTDKFKDALSNVKGGLKY